MLILQRKPGEAVHIGESITVSVMSVEGGRVRLAIDAPTDISILRSELVETIATNQDSVIADSSAGELLAYYDHAIEHRPAEDKKKE